MQQAHRDIDAVYGMGLFDDVKILPQPAEDSTLETPILDLTLQVKERKNGGFSGGVGISAQVTSGSLGCPSPSAFPLLPHCLAVVFLCLLFAFSPSLRSPLAFPLHPLCFPLPSVCIFPIPHLPLCLPSAPSVLSFTFSFVSHLPSSPVHSHTVGSKPPSLFACMVSQGGSFLALFPGQALHTVHTMHSCQKYGTYRAPTGDMTNNMAPYACMLHSPAWRAALHIPQASLACQAAQSIHSTALLLLIAFTPQRTLPHFVYLFD